MNRSINRWIYSLIILIFFAVAAHGQMRFGKLGVGLAASGYLWQSDLTTNSLGYGLAVSSSFSVIEYFSGRSLIGFNLFNGKESAYGTVTTNAFHAQFSANYDFLPHGELNPFVFGGFGFLYFDPRAENGTTLAGPGTAKWDINFLGGAGIDYFFDEFWSVTLEVEVIPTNSDALDGVGVGAGNDVFERISISLRYYFFDKAFIQRMVETLERRKQ